ncbi:MAG: kelch repeat-containing protein, partial [Acidobacteriota bacterium]
NIVLFGGDDGSPRNDTWLYDGTAWSAGPPSLVLARANHAMTYDAARQKVVLFGGRGILPLNDTWEWNGTTWLLGIPSPGSLIPRFDHALTYDASTGRVVLFGGQDGILLLNDVWLYDGLSWLLGPPPPSALTPRAKATLAATPTGVVLFGGRDAASLRDDTWIVGATSPLPLPQARTGHACAFDARRGRVVVFGGWDGGKLLNDTWELDGSGWIAGPQAPAGLTPRQSDVMAYDSAAGRQRLVLFGGSDASGLRNDTWEYDGNVWIQGPPAPAGLTPRQSDVMAYDSAAGRQRMVLFGGEDASGLRNDTWEYDGTGWTAGAVAPPLLTPRRHHAIAYDSGASRCVVFGGEDASGPRNDTWLYNGAAWSPGPGAPAGLRPRQSDVMAYDSFRGRTFLISGWDGSAYAPDTWEFDGTAWTPGPVPPADLKPRQSDVMAYDSLRGRFVIFAGSDGCHLGDTWFYAASAIRADTVTAAGAGASNPNRVRVFDAYGTGTPTDFLAYAAGGYGANASAAAIGGGAYVQLVTGPGPGPVLGPHVRGFLRDGTPMAKVSFFAYGTLKNGARVAAGRLDGDGYDEIVSGAGPGEAFGPHVRGWNYDATAVAAIAKVNFFAYATLHYGAVVAGGDVDGDAYAEILTAPGPGPTFAPHVRGWNVDGASTKAIGRVSFDAFPWAAYGAIAGAGDMDGDGFCEIATAPGPGPVLDAECRGYDYDGFAIAALAGFQVTPYTSKFGARIGAADLGGPTALDLIVGAGPDPAADTTVTAFAYDISGLTALPGAFVAMPGLTYGIEVSGGYLGM